jgi:hypothetical protein
LLPSLSNEKQEKYMQWDIGTIEKYFFEFLNSFSNNRGRRGKIAINMKFQPRFKPSLLITTYYFVTTYLFF